MFGSQKVRLLREDWPSPTELAEELYAMMDDSIPADLGNGPITANNPTSLPALTLGTSGDIGGVVLQVNGANGQPVGGIVLGDNGLQFASPSQLQAIATGGPGTLPVFGTNNPPGIDLAGTGTGANTSSAPTSFPGTIVGGAGSTYSATIYPDGLDGKGQDVAVTQLQIDSSETIPAGTSVIIVQTSDGKYQMQVPVWL